MSTSATHSKRHLDINADEINADLNGTINTATTATTQSTTDNSTKVSTTAFVKAQGYITTQSDTQDLTISTRTISLTDGGSVTVPAPTYASVTGKPTTFAPSSHTHAFASLTSKPTSIDGYGITDAFDGAYGSLSGTPTIPSGNQIIDWTSDQGATNVHAGNYTDTDTVYTHPTTAGNKHVPIDGDAGQFLKYSASGTAVWATPSYISNTDTNKFLSGISKSSNTLTFAVSGGTDQTYTFGSNAFNSTTIPAAEQYTAHENITAATSVNGTGRAYIQDITVDSNGHVTGIATASETVVNTNTTYQKASSNVLGLVRVGSGLAIGATGVLSVSQVAEANEETGGAMSSEDKTKLNAIEGEADVTDATNVAAAGASMKSATETISGAKTFSSTIAGSINGNSATTSERTITSGEISAISTNTSKVGITTGTQTIAGAKTFSTQIIGQKIYLGSASGLINRTVAQLASDGTDKVYVGSTSYGWNDARDWATTMVDVDTPILSYSDQYCGIICPVALSQVSIMSQLKINSANAVGRVKVYKGTRISGTTGDITLTEICSSGNTITSHSKFMNLDVVGTTAVAAGQLIVVGFGKTDSGDGQKPRFNFTLTGTTA